MCDRVAIENLLESGDYDAALNILRNGTEPSDALLRIRCRIGDRGYVRLCDKGDILRDIELSGDSRPVEEILSEFASPDETVFADSAVEKEIAISRDRALKDIRLVIDAVDARGDLGAADLKILCDAVVAIYRDHPMFPDLLVSADMWDVVRFRNYLHTLDITIPVNGVPHTPEALYAALVSLRKDLLLVEGAGCDLSCLKESDLEKVLEHGKSLADRKYPLRGLGKLTNRAPHDDMVEAYAESVENVRRMVREADRVRERIRRSVVVDAWDFREL